MKATASQIDWTAGESLPTILEHPAHLSTREVLGLLERKAQTVTRGLRVSRITVSSLPGTEVDCTIEVRHPLKPAPSAMILARHDFEHDGRLFSAELRIIGFSLNAVRPITFAGSSSMIR